MADRSETARDSVHKSKARLGINAYAVCVFVVALGGNAFRNALGWPGYLALVAALIVTGVALMLVKKPERFRWYRLPAPVNLFLAFATLSIIWSQYRLETVLGVVAQIGTTAVAIVLAYLLTWHETLRTLAISLRLLLSASLLFELAVSLFVRVPFVPWWVETPEGSFSKLYYWSRNLLFEGGPIQGVLGNSVVLGFIALLAPIVFVVQLRAGIVRPATGWSWVVVALATILLTRSATVTVAAIVVAISLLFALWARRTSDDRRMPLYWIGAALLTATIVGTLLARNAIFSLLGKSSDLTGRADIWQKVIDLIAERTWFGWGWVSHWAPWVEPFLGLDEQAGAPVMTAHNAWLDVWLQLGIVGLVCFILLVFVTTWRVWFRAVDQPRRGPGNPLPYATSALWPFLIMMAMLVQSLTESRLLIEGGWLLLVLFSVKTRFDYEVPASTDDERKLAWRDIPLRRGSAKAI